MSWSEESVDELFYGSAALKCWKTILLLLSNYIAVEFLLGALGEFELLIEYSIRSGCEPYLRPFLVRANLIYLVT